MILCGQSYLHTKFPSFWGVSRWPKYTLFCSIIYPSIHPTIHPSIHLAFSIYFPLSKAQVQNEYSFRGPCAESVSAESQEQSVYSAELHCYRNINGVSGVCRNSCYQSGICLSFLGFPRIFLDFLAFVHEFRRFFLDFGPCLASLWLSIHEFPASFQDFLPPICCHQSTTSLH